MAIEVSRRNNIRDRINNARGRWGLPHSAGGVDHGTMATAGDYNHLVNLTNEAKSHSGYPGGVEGHLGQGTPFRVYQLDNLGAQADAIANHCSCHGNCTGSCSGSCTGNCSGGCSGSCTGNCSGGCSGNCGSGCSTFSCSEAAH